MAQKTTITVGYDDGLAEQTIELPAHFEVCPRCEGHGTHLHEAIGSHAYTAEEFEESFDDEEREEYLRHGGRYDATCSMCNGDRVIRVIDRDACVTTEQQKALAWQDEQARDRAQWQREIEAERRAGC